jgi:hypothetical protein
VGRSRAREGACRRQAAARVDRLQRLSLVPRDGARVVRGRRHRRAAESALRAREGRSRGAARRRSHLHGFRGAHERPWRLAADGVLHAGRETVLRRHLFPARTASRLAVVPRSADVARPRLEHAARRGRAERERRRHAARAPARGRRDAATRRAVSARRRDATAAGRRSSRRRRASKRCSRRSTCCRPRPRRTRSIIWC